MSSSSRKGEQSEFTREGVEDYERRRYRGIDQRIVHAREVRLIRKYFGIMRAAEKKEPPERPVLDLPCGYGRFTGWLRENGRAVVNSDLSFEMVRRAGRKGGLPGAVANAKRGLPFRPGVFSLVFSVRFFHHVHDPSDRTAILREFCRVSSGWAIVSFYRMNGFHRLQRRLRRMFKKSRTAIKMIAPGQFEKEALDAGFETVKVRPLFRGLHAYHLALLRKK
jgi:SAM-dependent methyltransferase